MKGKLFNLFQVVFDNSKETAQSILGTTLCEFFFLLRAMWHFPEGDFEYFKGVIDNIQFNV